MLNELISKLREKIKNKSTQEIKQFGQNMHLKLNEEWKRTPLRNKLIKHVVVKAYKSTRNFLTTTKNSKPNHFPSNQKEVQHQT